MISLLKKKRKHTKENKFQDKCQSQFPKKIPQTFGITENLEKSNTRNINEIMNYNNINEYMSYII